MTGTGNYEGWYALSKGTGAFGQAEWAVNKNGWSKKTIASQDYSYRTTADGFTTTVSEDPWQPADAKLQTMTEGVDGEPHVLHTQAWRLASAVDSLRFKFLPNHDYYGCAGHKFWKDNTRDALSTQSGDSGMVKFMFDGASATVVGAAAVATAALAFF